MKYPFTLHANFVFLIFLLHLLFGNPLLSAQSTAEASSSTSLKSSPAVIFTIENTLTPPSEYFEYLDLSISSSNLEQVSPGVFHIYNLPLNRTYTLDFKGNGPPLLGVTTLDISMIQRHILGFAALDPIKLIAADATGDGRISASDLVDIRKVLLGKTPMFSAGVSWKFLPATASFTYTGTTIDLGIIKAIKIGHVN